MKDFILIIWNAILSFLKWILSDVKLFIITVLSIVLIFLYFNYRNTRSELENVVIEQQDSITTYKNKNDELYAQIGSYITDIDGLKKSNTELYNEVKYLKDNPIIVTKVKTEIVFQEKEVKDTVFVMGNDMYKIQHTYKDPFAYINMQTDFNVSNCTANTIVNNINFPSTFTLDLIESKKGDLSFIVKSDNPYIQINNVNGVMLSPEDSKSIKKRYDKKWCLVGGVGPTLTFVDGKFKCIPGIQLTFGYKIFAF
jgi:hypothetical protein